MRSLPFVRDQKKPFPTSPCDRSRSMASMESQLPQLHRHGAWFSEPYSNAIHGSHQSPTIASPHRKVILQIPVFAKSGTALEGRQLSGVPCVKQCYCRTTARRRLSGRRGLLVFRRSMRCRVFMSETMTPHVVADKAGKGR